MDLCELTNNPNWRQARHPWERARVRVIENFLGKLLSEHQKDTIHFLDIGSGDAYMALQVTKKYPNIHVHCVDIEYTEELKKRIEAELPQARISLYDSVEDYLERNPGAIPDIILLLDVIEHIEDDKAFLSYLKSSGVVGSETRLLITVPAYQKLFSSHDVYLKHYRRYTVKSLKESLSTAGMKSVQNGYFFTSLVMARYIQKALGIGNKIDEQKGISAYKPKPVLDQMFFGILMADFHLIKLFRLFGIKFPGLSCFSICKLNEA